MGDMQLFTQDIGGQNVAIKALMVDGAPWFRGNDVAAALGYACARNAVRNHVDEQYRETLHNLGGIVSVPLLERTRRPSWLTMLYRCWSKTGH